MDVGLESIRQERSNMETELTVIENAIKDTKAKIALLKKTEKKLEQISEALQEM